MNSHLQHGFSLLYVLDYLVFFKTHSTNLWLILHLYLAGVSYSSSMCLIRETYGYRIQDYSSPILVADHKSSIPYNLTHSGLEYRWIHVFPMCTCAKVNVIISTEIRTRFADFYFWTISLIAHPPKKEYWLFLILVDYRLLRWLFMKKNNQISL